jgi:hypothetical protein
MHGCRGRVIFHFAKIQHKMLHIRCSLQIINIALYGGHVCLCVCFSVDLSVNLYWALNHWADFVKIHVREFHQMLLAVPILRLTDS